MHIHGFPDISFYLHAIFIPLLENPLSVIIQIIQENVDCHKTKILFHPEIF